MHNGLSAAIAALSIVIVGRSVGCRLATPSIGREFKHTTHIGRVAIFGPAMRALVEPSMPWPDSLG